MPTRPLTLPVLRRIAGDRGQGLVEYALIVALVALISIGALEALGVEVFRTIDTATAIFEAEDVAPLEPGADADGGGGGHGRGGGNSGEGVGNGGGDGSNGGGPRGRP